MANKFKSYMTLLYIFLDSTRIFMKALNLLLFDVCRSDPATFSVRRKIVWSISTIGLYISYIFQAYEIN